MSWIDTVNNSLFRLSLKDKMLFARHMDMMTRSGMQTLDALEILKKQTRNKSFLRMLDSLIADVRNGQFLSVGMQRYRNIFGDFFINLIKVGETSGTLSENFKYLAEELAKKGELRSKIRGAMAYPIIILFATLGITGLLSFFIFPKILPVLRSLNTTLPLSTRMFIASSEFLFAYGLYMILALILFLIVFFMLLRIRRFKLAWHGIILKIPYVGRLSTEINIIGLSRTLNLLLRGGVKIVEALDITADTLSSLVYQDEVRRIAETVRRGEPMSRGMIANPRLFPATYAQMSSVGESTGKLDETMVFLADFYESELDNSTKSMSSVLEPALLLVMGGIVMFVAISIITPIYSMSQSLGR
ncbi:MAG: type II secretion system F family protein [Patescibacteria group bacterium]